MSKSVKTSFLRSRIKKLTTWLGGNPRTLGELEEILQYAEGKHLIDAQTLEMLQGVLEVSQMHVRDVMVPRGQMEVLRIDHSLEENLKVIIESGHSRFPVIGEHRDKVLGILLAKDLLQYCMLEKTEVDLSHLIRSVELVPSSKRLDDLLKEFRIKRNHMVMVADEYGGIAGLITIEDVLEEIVGEIEDEFDHEEPYHTIQRRSPTVFEVDALMRIEDFNEYFATGLPEDNFDTIGGVVVGQFGYLPRAREAIQMGSLHFEVLTANQRRVKTLRVTFAEAPPDREIVGL